MAGKALMPDSQDVRREIVLWLKLWLRAISRDALP